METVLPGSVQSGEYRTREISDENLRERTQRAAQPAQGKSASAIYVLKPLQSDPSISDGGPCPSAPRLSPSGNTVVPAAGSLYAYTRSVQTAKQKDSLPFCRYAQLASRKSQHINSGSDFVNRSEISSVIASAEPINQISTLDNQTLTSSSDGRGRTSESAGQIRDGYDEEYYAPHGDTRHVTCSAGMTRITNPSSASDQTRLSDSPNGTLTRITDSKWSIKKFNNAATLASTSDMMLSPHNSEVGLLTMEADSRTSSRTSTPTMVRTRPRLPAELMRPKDLFLAATAALSCTNLAPAQVTSAGARSEDIACDFNSLGRTDFVRKYSTKVRSNTDPMPRNFRPISPLQDNNASLLPAATQQTLLLMSGGENERDRSIRPHTLGGLTPTRTRSVRLKFEKLRLTRRPSDSNPDGIQLDPDILASYARQHSDSPEIISNDCDNKGLRRSTEDTTGILDMVGRTTDTRNPRGQNQNLQIKCSHPPMADERKYHTFPGRRSASPTMHSDSPSDKEVGKAISKTVAADRRLCHQNAIDKVSTEPQMLHDRPPDGNSRLVSPEGNISFKSSSPKPPKHTRPAVVHWQLGRVDSGSVDSDRSTPPSDHNQPGVNHVNKNMTDIAEDEGVGEIDLAPDDSFNVPDLPSGPRKGPWISLTTPDIIRGTLNTDNQPRNTDRTDSVTCAVGKLPNGRFSTHPPSKDRSSATEGGSKDSNGFCALRDARVIEELTPEELQLKLSSVSIDSQSCIGDVNYASYHEVVQDVTSDGTNIDIHLERKNSKSLKQKSKSDPCGEKQKESLRMSPTMDATVLSTPALLEGNSNATVEFPGSMHNDAEKNISVSDSVLAYSDQADEESGETTNSQESAFMIKAHRSSSRKRNNRASRESKKSEEDIDLKIKPITSIIVESDGDGQSSDATQSPLNTLEKGTSVEDTQSGSGLVSLTLPYTKTSTNTALTRSQSSASVFLSKAETYRQSTLSPGSNRQKDLVKRRPHFLDHLGHGPGSNLGHKKDSSWTTSYCPSLEPIYAQSSLSLFEGADAEKDKRDLIVQEFYSTEEQYVEALQMLVERYMIPMKTKSVVDGNLVDDIFYKVNEIYMHHATFLTFLGKALQDWDSSTSTIGDIIHKNFSKQTVIESYVSFIENFPKAEKVLDEILTKSSFQKFIEVCERENKMRLPLKAHIVKPAQRIPRYELLLKRLLDNTPTDHPDHRHLLDAENSIHQLALRINSAKECRQEEDYQDTLKRLELLLITDLAVADRTYIRHDMIQILSRKDQCCIWLFSDLAVFSSVKRKSGPVNRKTTLLLQSPTGNDFVENCKHKMWLKISMEDLEIVQLEPLPQKKPLVDKDILESDEKILNQISDLAAQLDSEHVTLDEAVNELFVQVNKQLTEHQRKSPPPEANKVELMANTTEGLEHLVLVFSSQEKRASWEMTFAAAKRKLVALSEGKPPEFQQALPITKTRAGMQFSCAAAIDGFNEKHFRDVWVCNSDGYVGHMCLLSLQPEPIVTLNTPLPGCNSRILCICAVPTVIDAHKRKNSRRRLGVQPPTILVQRAESDRVLLRSRRQQDFSQSPIMSQSSTSDTDSSASAEEEEPRSRKISTGSKLKLSSSAPATANQPDGKQMDPKKSTMWLGTEDGCILVFPSTDNLKTTKNKVKLQQNAAVLCICYIECKVFASLSNGDLVVYSSKPDGTWDLSKPVTLTVSTGAVPVNKLLSVAGRLWCACQHEIYIVNPQTMAIEVSFAGNPEEKKPIHCMATSGHGVWVACQQSAKVYVFHALSNQHLTHINVSQTVAHKLQNADDIIRQHKTACLRITSLVTCKDQLWIGTSAGVILNMPLPKITQATDKNSITLGTLTGLSHGHTGHVRFLTCVDMSSHSRRSLHQDEFTSSEGSAVTWPSRRMSIGLHTFNSFTKMLVISGGDGYEDFRTMAPTESTGRDDSTNHLLLWQV